MSVSEIETRYLSVLGIHAEIYFYVRNRVTVSNRDKLKLARAQKE